MASISEGVGKNGKPRFTVRYRHETTGSNRAPTFKNLDDAVYLFYCVENSALSWRTAELTEIRKAWTLQKLVWFYLGFQHDKLNRNIIKLSSYTKCRADLLTIQGDILKRNIMQVSTRDLSLILRPGAKKWMRSAFHLLVEKKIISFNPQEQQKARERKPITIPSKATVKKLLNDGPWRERLACWLGAICGMRIGEVLALTYSDVSKEWINISKHITPEGLKEGLKRGLQRRVKMPRDLFALLDAEKFGTASPIIANHRTGSPLGLGYSNQGVLRALLTSHGVKRFHDLRHFAVSRLAENGTDILLVSRMIGHSRVSTTLDIYGHLFCDSPDLDFD